MDLQPYVDNVRHELRVAAAAGGDEAEALADRLTAPLESSIRLALLEALSEAADLITRDVAPGSVEVRLRGRDPEFSVTAGPEELPEAPAVAPADADDDGGTWRVTLRLPESLRQRRRCELRDFFCNSLRPILIKLQLNISARIFTYWQ